MPNLTQLERKMALVSGGCAHQGGRALDILRNCCHQIMDGPTFDGEGVALATLRNASEYLQNGSITGLRGVAYYSPDTAYDPDNDPRFEREETSSRLV